MVRRGRVRQVDKVGNDRAVNDDGLSGSDCNPLVWRAGSLSNRRKIVEAFRDFAMLPGPQALWSGGWQDWVELNVTAEDVRIWLFSVGSLVKLVAFLSSLHWPSEFHDLGPGGTLPPETCAVVFWEGVN